MYERERGEIVAATSELTRQIVNTTPKAKLKLTSKIGWLDGQWIPLLKKSSAEEEAAGHYLSLENEEIRRTSMLTFVEKTSFFVHHSWV